jgi:lysophospholipase L1-like esterase
MVGPARYVALGDSYASGNGARANGFAYDPAPPTENPACKRSLTAYGRVLGAELAQQPLSTFDAATDHLACSGARIGFLGDTTTDTLYGQIELAKLDASVKLVTVTIGGNDIDFSQLASCIVGLPDPTLPVQNAPNDCSPRLDAAAKIVTDPAFQGRLSGAFEQIRDHAPNAAVWVVGYPQLYAPPVSFSRRSCDVVSTFAVSDNEIRSSRALISSFDQSIKIASVAAGVHYLDASEELFKDHWLCTKGQVLSRGSWVNPPRSSSSRPALRPSSHPRNRFIPRPRDRLRLPTREGCRRIERSRQLATGRLMSGGRPHRVICRCYKARRSASSYSTVTACSSTVNDSPCGSKPR